MSRSSSACETGTCGNPRTWKTHACAARNAALCLPLRVGIPGMTCVLIPWPQCGVSGRLSRADCRRHAARKLGVPGGRASSSVSIHTGQPAPADARLPDAGCGLRLPLQSRRCCSRWGDTISLPKLARDRHTLAGCRPPAPPRPHANDIEHGIAAHSITANRQGGQPHWRDEYAGCSRYGRTDTDAFLIVRRPRLDSTPSRRDELQRHCTYKLATQPSAAIVGIPGVIRDPISLAAGTSTTTPTRERLVIV